MKEAKRTKLKAKGWKIGTARNFIGMSDEEEGYVNLRLKLANGLKTRRQAHGITEVGLARRSSPVSHALPRWKRATLRCPSTCS
jgi:hypothetical protein